MEREAGSAMTVDSPSRGVDFGGRWKNELGSTMELSVIGSVIEGFYKSAVSGDGEPIEGPLRGFAVGDLIAFTVMYPSTAIAAWVGRYRSIEGRDVIDTLWQMTTKGEDDKDAFWQSILAGADRFER